MPPSDREKQRAYKAAWYEKNKERQQALARERYANNKHLWKNPDGTWKKANVPDDVRRERSRASYHRNRDAVMERTKARRKQRQRFGICLICAEPGKLVHDHNHRTGSWRDWICSPCNLLVGFAYESPETLRAAAQYLEDHAHG